MHIQTHLMSGWCMANQVELTARERALAMVAASAADLDGLGLLVSMEFYATYHHVLGHNLLFGVLLSSILTVFSTHRLKAFLLYLALFHLHLLMDYFGSGPGWGVVYWWPFSLVSYESAYAWSLGAWQNMVTACFLLVWVLVIILRKRRTPLEAIWPRLDKEIVQQLTGRFSKWAAIPKDETHCSTHKDE